MKVAIAGPGLMGSQIGCEYALGGHDVVFLVRRLDVARQRVAAALALAGGSGLWDPEAVAAAPGRLSYVDRLDALDPATEIFVESIAEDADAKIELLARAAGQLPTAILASNTSAISIGTLGAGAGAPDRTLGAHYWNPPLLMPLVELISGPETDLAAVATMIAVLRGIGKRPVQVDRDVDGFVWNRLQLALLREAVWIVENGVASTEVVDEIVRDGLARRWRYTGPFATAALGGPATFARVANNLWPSLSTATELADLEQWLTLTPDELSGIRAARDAGLLADLKQDRADDG